MRRSLLLLSLLTLCACGAGRGGDTTGIGRESHAAQTGHESCMAACTRDYNICMDESSNSREALPGMGTLPSAGLDCGRDLKSCQKRCAAL